MTARGGLISWSKGTIGGIFPEYSVVDMSQSEAPNSPSSDLLPGAESPETHRPSTAKHMTKRLHITAIVTDTGKLSARRVLAGNGANTKTAMRYAQAEGTSEKETAAVSAPGKRLLALRARVGEWARGIELPPSPRTIRLLVATCSGLLLLALLPALLNASHHSVGAVSAPPTATLMPTATPLSVPTAMPGYQPLVDSTDGFVIQYPLAWTCSTSNPGIDCMDSPSAQNYRLQVQLPGGWTGADTGKNPDDASVWVDYALSAFSDVPGRTYQRLADANQSAVIGGVIWQGGAAVVGIEPDNASNEATATPTQPLALIRVQVYATLYSNRPYIIALYAANDQFDAGSARYFQPMLNSFAFLPASHDS